MSQQFLNRMSAKSFWCVKFILKLLCGINLYKGFSLKLKVQYVLLKRCMTKSLFRLLTGYMGSHSMSGKYTPMVHVPYEYVYLQIYLDMNSAHIIWVFEEYFYTFPKRCQQNTFPVNISWVIKARQDRQLSRQHLQDRFIRVTETALQAIVTHQRPISADTVRRRLTANSIRCRCLLRSPVFTARYRQ